MINQVAINVKIDSILEPDNRLFLNPNSLGLYNVSEMFRRFAQAKSDLAIKNNDPLASTTYTAFSQAVELLVSGLEQSESLVTINGEYWCDLSYLQLLLKFCSTVYADAVNHLENTSEITLGEWSDYTSKKYSIICFFGDDNECYISSAIWAASRILRDEKGLYDFVICTEIKVNELTKKYALSDENSSKLSLSAWRLSAHSMDIYMKYFAETQTHSYQKLVEIMQESMKAVEQKAVALSTPVSTPTVAPQKKGFLSRFF